LLLVPAIGLTVLLVQLRRAPADIDPASVPVLAEVTTSETRPSAPVSVTITFGVAPQVRAPAFGGGLVGAISVGPGDELRSGDTLLEVDGVARIALYTPEPFWRAMSRGSTGRDVAALEAFLVEGGWMDGTPDDTYDWTTRQAVKTFESTIGIQRPTGTFDPAYVVWMPEPSVAVGEVDVEPGMLAPSRGEPVLTGVPEAIAGAVSDERPDLNPGEEPWILEVAGLDLGEVDQSGSLSSRQLDTLAAAYRAGTVTPATDGADASGADSSEVHFNGTVELATPVIEYRVPVGAVLGSRTTAGAECIFLQADDGSFQAFPTHVVDGDFASVSIEPAPPPPALVLVNPLDILASPECG
jgi:peptidoglycan hydrolase-like protein with peptidoglycan-binding domain